MGSRRRQGPCSCRQHRKRVAIPEWWAHTQGQLSLRNVMQLTTNSEYARGALYGLAAVCIWAAFIVVSRLGVKSSLTPWDVAAIRFATAGVLLLPYLLKKG